MDFSPADIFTQYKNLGLQAGDVVMLHAGLRSVGSILGGPDVLISELVKIISPDGAVMMYIASESPFDDVGRKERDGTLRLGKKESWILENCPVFDYKYARACRDNGYLAEIFRTREKVICSHHVSWRMAAEGDKAEWLMADHPLNFGADKDSPMDKLVKLGGKVLLIGSDFDHASILHYAEGLTKIEPKKKVQIKFPLLKDGQRVWVDIVENNSSTGIVDWPEFYFTDIIRNYISIYPNSFKKGKIGYADSYLFDAQDLVYYAISEMKKTAAKMIL